MEIVEKLKLIHEAALSKKVYDPVILDVGDLTKVTDYFVIYTAGNPIHAQAIADSVLEIAELHGEEPLHREGLKSNNWILLDFGEIVVHIMLKEVREYYLLEKLWSDAPRVSLEESLNEKSGTRNP